MRRITPLLATVITLFIAGCEQQQPIAGKPPPPPGHLPGETPPPDIDQGVTLAPATAPTTPGVQNHPAAPASLPPPPSTAPCTTPTTAP